MEPRRPKKASKHSAIVETFLDFLDYIGPSSTWLSAMDKYIVTLVKKGSVLAGAVGGGLLDFLKELPLAGNFVTGIVQFQIGWDAFRHPNTPQRLTKIGSGIVGGLVAFGVGIVGAIVLAGVLVAAPYILPAITIGIYLPGLYRDSYILHQSRMKLERIDNRISELSRTLQGPEGQAELEELQSARGPAVAAYKRSRMNVVLSTILVVGFVLALGAVFATGIGAAVVGGIAAVAIMGVMTKRIWNRYQDSKKTQQAAAMAQRQETPGDELELKEKPRLDKKLEAGPKDDVKMDAKNDTISDAKIESQSTVQTVQIAHVAQVAQVAEAVQAVQAAQKIQTAQVAQVAQVAEGTQVAQSAQTVHTAQTAQTVQSTIQSETQSDIKAQSDTKSETPAADLPTGPAVDAAGGPIISTHATLAQFLTPENNLTGDPAPQASSQNDAIFTPLTELPPPTATNDALFATPADSVIETIAAPKLPATDVKMTENAPIIVVKDSGVLPLPPTANGPLGAPHKQSNVHQGADEKGDEEVTTRARRPT